MNVCNFTELALYHYSSYYCTCATLLCLQCSCSSSCDSITL